MKGVSVKIGYGFNIIIFSFQLEVCVGVCMGVVFAAFLCKYVGLCLYEDR